MGNKNNHSSENYVEREVIKMQILKQSLNNKLLEKDNKISALTYTNNQLLDKIHILESEKLNLTQLKDETSNKCQELEERNKALKSELTKYESLPALKQIMELYKNLQVFQLDIKMTTVENSNDEQVENFTAKIADKKTANVKLQNILEQKSLNTQQRKQLIQAEEQLTQAEKTLEKVRLNYRSFLDDKQRKVILFKDKIKTCEHEFDKFSDTIGNIEEQLKDYQKQIIYLQNKDDQLKKQEWNECEKILTLLERHYSAMRGIIKLVESDKRNLENNFDNDNFSEASQSENVFLYSNEKNKYAVVLYNLKESPYDQQKVEDIINCICQNFAEKIEIQRLGAFYSNKIRPIKVFVPTFKCVSEILANKWKLKSNNYHYINIAPFNKKKTTGNTK